MKNRKKLQLRKVSIAHLKLMIAGSNDPSGITDVNCNTNTPPDNLDATVVTCQQSNCCVPTVTIDQPASNHHTCDRTCSSKCNI